MAKPGPNQFSSQVRKYCVEKRNPETGALDFSLPQPPFMEATDEMLWQFYFKKNPGQNPTASQEEIGEWYAQQGWFWRPKTW